MVQAFYETLFSDAVRQMQQEQGTDRMYARHLSDAAPRKDVLGPDEVLFLSLRDGFYQATVSENGWPYVQFRGGPRGFLKVLDEKTIAYADFRGNRQYISDGNLRTDDRIAIIAVDYPNSARIKILGRARLSDDVDLIQQLRDADYRGYVERAVVIDVEAFDWNCPQHLPVRLTMEELQPMLAPFQQELAQLRAENAQLKEQLSKGK
ncbi:MAG: pyridoxamine 5'-phosphate oxidase family protein [Pseudomonadota bacterium]